MIGLVILGLFVALATLAILGWTADSRDNDQKLWPLQRIKLDYKAVPVHAAPRQPVRGSRGSPVPRR